MLLFLVIKEYGNRYDFYVCLVWVLEIEKIFIFLWNYVIDGKCGERVRIIVGFFIGRVLKGLFLCFYEFLGFSIVECIEWYVN